MSEDTTLTGSADEETRQPESDAATETAEQAKEAKAADATPDAKDDDAAKAADAETSSEQEDADQPDDDAKPKRKGAIERIKQLTAKARSEERAREAAERRAQEAEDRLKKYETPAPKESSFDSYEEYQAALAAHQYRQLSKQDREDDIKSARDEARKADEQAHAAMKEAFIERAVDFAERVPDYHQKVADTSLPITPEMASEIHASEKGPEIAYFLATHRAEAARIAGLTNSREVAREIGRIEGRLSAPAPKKITAAPAPVKSVASGSGSKRDFDPATASHEDMKAYLKREGVI